MKRRRPLAIHNRWILNSLAHPLAMAGVSIIARSTYDTDFILVPDVSLTHAAQLLSEEGHIVHGWTAA